MIDWLVSMRAKIKCSTNVYLFHLVSPLIDESCQQQHLHLGNPACF